MFDWKFAYAENYKCKDAEPKSIADIEKSGYDIIKATVPGNFEIDFMREGILPDLYYSTNTLLAQKTENLHFWYFSAFEIHSASEYLRFEGIDTIADIYINGKLVRSTDNMFLPCDVNTDYIIGANEVVVHIRPVCIEVRKRKVPSVCWAWRYHHQAFAVRKAAHMFGWDIMPRIVSAGIWKPVELRTEKKEKINELYVVTNRVDVENRLADIRLFVDVDVDGDFIKDYSIRFIGVCGDSRIEFEKQLWHTSFQFTETNIPDCKFWQPKNCGEPNIYSSKVQLLYKGGVIDEKRLNVGLRTTRLIYSDAKSGKEPGDFCFEVNGKRIFALGTNWVPLDALHSNDDKRLDRALALLDDSGCNMVRCWGGGVYESDKFFDFCDSHGIMVWQDFAMACAVYPQDEAFFKQLEEEVVFEIKRLRNHPSLSLWCGDNEVDVFYQSRSDFPRRDPNMIRATRDIIKYAVEAHDYARSYLPSTPYVSPKMADRTAPLAEDHLWGWEPIDYFKSDYYVNSRARFVSEIGYKGFPSPESLDKFLENPEKIFGDDGRVTDEYIVHAASMELSEDAIYAGRIRVTCNQVKTFFGEPEKAKNDFVKQSQIVQAEADKFFIERLRADRENRTGIIWWNLLDGWPQISDAVVDYYFVKKLAYHYIKRAQAPLCLMFGAPEDGRTALRAVNDLPEKKTAEYKVTDLTKGNEVLRGRVSVEGGSALTAAVLDISGSEKSFLLIEWVTDGREYKNHYLADLQNVDYKSYMQSLKRAGFDEFEGF